jgi:hypothetical protein
MRFPAHSLARFSGRGLVGVTTSTDEKKRMWVVCCEPKVVVAGWATEKEIEKEHPCLTNVRMCVYWDVATGGPHGLASIGPQSGCRVTKAAPRQKIRTKVQTVLLCSKKAIESWKAEPWG